MMSAVFYFSFLVWSSSLVYPWTGLFFPGSGATQDLSRLGCHECGLHILAANLAGLSMAFLLWALDTSAVVLIYCCF